MAVRPSRRSAPTSISRKMASDAPPAETRLRPDRSQVNGTESHPSRRPAVEPVLPQRKKEYTIAKFVFGRTSRNQLQVFDETSDARPQLV